MNARKEDECKRMSARRMEATREWMQEKRMNTSTRKQNEYKERE